MPTTPFVCCVQIARLRTPVMLRWTRARLATAALAAPALALRATIRSPAELLRAVAVFECAFKRCSTTSLFPLESAPPLVLCTTVYVNTATFVVLAVIVLHSFVHCSLHI
jgi:hypothetical protein